MQLSTDRLKFGFHGYTLLEAWLLIAINSHEVRNGSYVWGSGC